MMQPVSQETSPQKPQSLKAFTAQDDSHKSDVTSEASHENCQQPSGNGQTVPANQDDGTNCIAADIVCNHIGERAFQHWFSGKTSFETQSDVLTIGVSNPFLLNWMQKQFREPLHQTAVELLGPSGTLRFVVDPRLSLQTEHPTDRLSDQSGDTAADVPSAGQRVTEDDSAQAVTRRSTGRRFARLTEFVAGTCNELAFTASRHVCDSPGDQLNPLFLHGGAGTGKTHLLEGIYAACRRQHSNLQAVYLTCEAFTNYFTQALNDRTLPGFRQRFRHIDVLLVDDIDFLDSKRGIQEEFLHTITELQNHGRQIVIASDRHPRLLTKLSEELTSRFMSGLVCRLETPDEETRQRIVECKAARLPMQINADALHYVASRFVTNVRELEGALNTLLTWHRMTGRRVTLSTARRLLNELERDCIRMITMQDIEKVVCRVFGVDHREMKSSTRKRSISQPRMLAMYLARRHTTAAYSEIGRYFGNRNHSTVVAAEKRVNQWLEQNEVVRVAAQHWPLNDLLQTVEEQLRAAVG